MSGTTVDADLSRALFRCFYVPLHYVPVARGQRKLAVSLWLPIPRAASVPASLVERQPGDQVEGSLAEYIHLLQGLVAAGSSGAAAAVSSSPLASTTTDADPAMYSPLGQAADSTPPSLSSGGLSNTAVPPPAAAADNTADSDDDAASFTFGALLEHIPYRRTDGTAARDARRHVYLCAFGGFACCRSDMYGSGDSAGVLQDEYLQEPELTDAVDLINWLGTQPWSNGNVGMFGKSWGAFNALMVAGMDRAVSHLCAVMCVAGTDDRYGEDVHYMGGCPLMEALLPWSNVMLGYNAMPPDPCAIAAAAQSGGENQDDATRRWTERLQAPHAVAEWIRHQRRDSYWQHGSMCNDGYAKLFDRRGDARVPILATGGWADGYTSSPMRLVAAEDAYGVPEGERRSVYGIIGPWSHNYCESGVPGPAIPFLQESIAWWRAWLNDDTLSPYHPHSTLPQVPALRLWLLDALADRDSAWDAIEQHHRHHPFGGLAGAPVADSRCAELPDRPGWWIALDHALPRAFSGLTSEPSELTQPRPRENPTTLLPDTEEVELAFDQAATCRPAIKDRSYYRRQQRQASAADDAAAERTTPTLEKRSRPSSATEKTQPSSARRSRSGSNLHLDQVQLHTTEFSRHGSGYVDPERPPAVARVTTDLRHGGAMGGWWSLGAPAEAPRDQITDDTRALAFDFALPLSGDVDIVGHPVVHLRLASDQPIAQVAVRFCAVEQQHLEHEGGQWHDVCSKLLTYGALNLTHAGPRGTHEHPASVAPGEFVDYRVPLRPLACRIDSQFAPSPRGRARPSTLLKDDRLRRRIVLRVAVAPSLFPMLWPPARPVALDLEVGSCRLCFTSLRPADDGAAVAAEIRSGPRSRRGSGSSQPTASVPVVTMPAATDDAIQYREPISSGHGGGGGPNLVVDASNPPPYPYFFAPYGPPEHAPPLPMTTLRDRPDGGEACNRRVLQHGRSENEDGRSALGDDSDGGNGGGESLSVVSDVRSGWTRYDGTTGVAVFDRTVDTHMVTSVADPTTVASSGLHEIILDYRGHKLWGNAPHAFLAPRVRILATCSLSANNERFEASSEVRLFKSAGDRDDDKWVMVDRHETYTTVPRDFT